jgi:hypothetical protein
VGLGVDSCLKEQSSNVFDGGMTFFLTAAFFFGGAMFLVLF